MNRKCCSICGVELDDHPYAYMRGDGELVISFISIYGIDYTLCPSCTDQLNLFLNELSISKRNERHKKTKMININDIKKR